MMDEKINLKNWWTDSDSQKTELLGWKTCRVPVYPRHKFHMDWRGMNPSLRGGGQAIASKSTRLYACIWLFQRL
jgi:hypothetical protein